MKRFRFNISGIMCDSYNDEKMVSRTAAIHLYGFPATIGETELTPYLTGHSYFLIQPHYPGTYDSAGLFDPASSIQMVCDLQRGIRQGTVVNLKNDQKEGIPTNITLAIGHSFGCLIALNSIRFLPELKTLLLFAPVVTYGSEGPTCGFSYVGEEFISYIQRSRPYTYRLADDAQWEKLFAGEFNFPCSIADSKIDTVIGVVGAQDRDFDLKVLQSNFESIVRGYVGSRPTVELLVIHQAGHSIKDLLTDELKSKLETTLS